MNAIQLTSFTGHNAFQAMMATKVNTQEMLSSTANLTSVDYDFFSKTFSIAFGERGARDSLADFQKAQKEITQQRENDKGDLELSASASSEAMQEQREELMMKIGEFEFTDADLTEALEDIVKAKDVFAEKYGLNEKQANEAEHHAIIMLAMSPEEREDYLRQLEQTDPKIAHAIGEEAELIHGGREHVLSITESAPKALEADDVMAEIAEQDNGAFALDGSGNDFGLDIPEQTNTSTFTLDM